MRMPFLCTIAWLNPDRFYAVVIVFDDVAVLEPIAVLV